jgi:hypothetical protein
MQCLLCHYMISHTSYSMSSQRITITVKTDVHRKLRLMQSEMLKKTNATVSMSGVIDTVLRKVLK